MLLPLLLGHAGVDVAVPFRAFLSYTPRKDIQEGKLHGRGGAFV